jgi:NifU-like protein involved in Fe-S cluster formation
MQNLIRKTNYIFKTVSPINFFRYHEKVIDRFENPTNVGSLDAKKKTVGTGIILNFMLNALGLAGHPACGDIMKLQIEVGEDGKTIEKAVFKVYN